MKARRFHVRAKRIVSYCLLMLVVFAAPCELFASDVYVSVDGSAQADGTLQKPFGSLPDAVEAVRALRKAGNTDPVKIILRKGRHQLNQTLVLCVEDGSPTTPSDVTLEQYGAGDTTGPAFLTFAAFPGEHPVVSGGIPVTDWKRLESAPAELPAKAVGKVWVADMPEGMDRFYTLYDSHGRLSRARNSGFAYTKPGNTRTLHFPEGALKNWNNLEDVEIQVRPSRAWVINMLPLACVDETNGVAKTSVSATYQMGPLPGWVHNPSGANVWVENILEALNEPGEWVVNTKTRKIYLWPSDPAQNGSPRGILAPSTSELIRVEGAVDYDGPTDEPVRGIAFSGLTFTHGDRWAWTTDDTRLGWGMQHDWDMFDRPTALLRFRGAEDCRVTNCCFINSGGSGLRLDLHAQRNRVVNSEFAHLGEAGILLAGYGPGTKDVNHHNDIINNYIHHFSEITWHSPGLWAWQSGHNRIVHNELHHSGYSAVLITTRVNPDRDLNGEGGRTVRHHEIAQESGARARGGYASWQRREKYLHSRHNLFEYNEISHAVQLLSDGNGIYVSGTGAGNIIRYNYLHDNLAHSLPAAIRCDDDQHETLIYGNVLFNNRGFSAGIASKGINDIVNNFIVDQAMVPSSGYISFEWVPVPGSKVQRNIIVSHPDGGKAHNERYRGRDNGGRPKPKLVDTDMDNNLYYHPTDPNWMDEHLSKMHAVGKEKASLVGDPLFADPAGGDFSFREGSPARKLGIEPLDVSKMGRKDLGGKVNNTGYQGQAAHYPAFSWDTVPVGFHFGKDGALMTAEEAEFVASRASFICLEKGHAGGQFKYTEDGIEQEAQQLKKLNPDMKVIFYWNTFLDYGMFRAHQDYQQHPEWWLKTVDGKLDLKNGRMKRYDLSHPEVRAWWTDVARRAVVEGSCDGVFLDAFPQILAERNKTLWGQQKYDAIQRGLVDIVKETRTKIGENKLIFYNGIRSTPSVQIGVDFMENIDAVMIEHFGHFNSGSKECMLKDIQEMTKAGKHGKIVVFKGWPGFTFIDKAALRKPLEEQKKLAAENITFPLAAFLVGAQEHSYFIYNWGYRMRLGCLEWYPELDKQLGPPLADAKQTGWVLERDFEHAHVWIDLEAREARIDWQ